MLQVTRLKKRIEYLKAAAIFSPNIDRAIQGKIFLLCSNIVFAMAGLGIIGPVLPEIQAWGNISTLQLGLFVSAYSLTRICANIPAGYLSDYYRGNSLTAIAMLTLATGSLLSAFASSFFILITGRIVTGVGSSLAVVSIQTELLSLASNDNRSTIMSYYMIARRAGSSIFPFIGGALAVFFSTWRAVFLFCAFLHFTGMLIALVPLKKNNLLSAAQSRKKLPPGPKEEEEEKEEKKDKDKIETNREKGAKREINEGYGTSGKREKPLIFLTLYALVFFIFLNREGLEKTILPLYGGIIGLNSMQIGAVLSLASVVSIGAIFFGGYFADRYGRKIILQIGLLVLILANGLFLGANDFWKFLMVKIFFGIAAFTSALPLIIATDLVHPSRIGRTLGGIRLFEDIGMVAGPVALGWVMDYYGFSMTIGVSITIIITGTLMATFFLEETGRKLDKHPHRDTAANKNR